MKVLSKKEIVAKKEVAHTIGERKILQRSLESPFLVGLKFSFQTDTELYLVTDFKSGGELFWHLQRETRFSEERARFYVAELTLALEHLHKYNIVYRCVDFTFHQRSRSDTPMLGTSNPRISSWTLRDTLPCVTLVFQKQTFVPTNSRRHSVAQQNISHRKSFWTSKATPRLSISGPLGSSYSRCVVGGAHSMQRISNRCTRISVLGR